MARSDKSPRGPESQGAAHEVSGATPPVGDAAAANPRGSEYLASGLVGDAGVGHASPARRRAWGLTEERFGLLPSSNRDRGGKKDRKRGKGPSTKGEDGLHGQGNGSPPRTRFSGSRGTDWEIRPAAGNGREGA